MCVQSSTVLRVIVSVIAIFKRIFSHMAFPVKQVWASEEQLRIIEEVGKTPSEKRIDIARRLGLPPSTLNSSIAKKREVRAG
jgi:predicted transcriptional regulator